VIAGPGGHVDMGGQRFTKTITSRESDDGAGENGYRTNLHVIL